MSITEPVPKQHRKENKSVTLKIKQYSQEITHQTHPMYCVMSHGKLTAIPDAENVASQLVKSQNNDKKKKKWVTQKKQNCIMLSDGDKMTPRVEMNGHVVG